MSANMLDAALDYAARGMYVFPCKENQKVPKTRNGHLDATIDHHQIHAWWSESPHANIGISLAKSGLVAIDVDSHKPDCAWSAFSFGKEIPETLE